MTLTEEQVRAIVRDEIAEINAERRAAWDAGQQQREQSAQKLQRAIETIWATLSSGGES